MLKEHQQSWPKSSEQGHQHLQLVRRKEEEGQRKMASRRWQSSQDIMTDETKLECSGQRKLRKYEV